MKIQRLLLAAAVVMAVAGCSGDATAPDPASRPPRVAPATSTDPMQPTTVTPPGGDDGGGDGTGGFGSGCCVKP